MPQTFKIKNSVEADKVPAAGDLATAELALNLKDQKLYSKDADGNVFEIGEAPDLDGFVKLDDEGTAQSIVGGGGLEVAGPLASGSGTGSSFVGVQLRGAGNLSIVNTNGTNLINAESKFGPTNTFVVDESANVTTTGGVTSEFGDSTAQKGNVAPLNDWSCYPARGTVFYAPPAPIPSPEPEPVDPEFGVDEPTFSAGFTSGGIVGTQDIINLEGE